MQPALVSVVTHQQELSDITRGVLVEMADARITHHAETRMVLAVLSPKASVDTVTAVAR